MNKITSKRVFYLYWVVNSLYFTHCIVNVRGLMLVVGLRCNAIESVA